MLFFLFVASPRGETQVLPFIGDGDDRFSIDATDSDRASCFSGCGVWFLGRVVVVVIEITCVPETGGVVHDRRVEVFGDAVSDSEGVIGCTGANFVLLVCLRVFIVVCMMSLFALV